MSRSMLAALLILSIFKRKWANPLFAGGSGNRHGGFMHKPTSAQRLPYTGCNDRFPRFLNIRRKNWEDNETSKRRIISRASQCYCYWDALEMTTLIFWLSRRKSKLSPSWRLKKRDVWHRAFWRASAAPIPNFRGVWGASLRNFSWRGLFWNVKICSF